MSSCCICLESVDAKDLVAHGDGDGQKHPIHEDCVRSWLKTSDSCPLCKKKVYILPTKREFAETIVLNGLVGGCGAIVGFTLPNMRRVAAVGALTGAVFGAFLGGMYGRRWVAGSTGLLAVSGAMTGSAIGAVIATATVATVLSPRSVIGFVGGVIVLKKIYKSFGVGKCDLAMVMVGLFIGCTEGRNPLSSFVIGSAVTGGFFVVEGLFKNRGDAECFRKIQSP